MENIKDINFKGTYSTREKYLEYLKKRREKYAADENFRKKQKDYHREYQKKYQKLIMSSPALYAKYRAKIRVYQREYARRKRAKLKLLTELEYGQSDT